MMENTTKNDTQFTFKAFLSAMEKLRNNFSENMNYEENTPNHYKIGDLDTMKIIIEIVKNNNLDTEESIYLFNTLKYLVRFGNKDGVKDLEKAKDYLNRLIDKICE